MKDLSLVLANIFKQIITKITTEGKIDLKDMK